MRAVTRLTQIVRSLSSHAGKSAQPAAPVDPLKNVVGKSSKTDGTTEEIKT